MLRHDIIVIGASAGGVEALTELVRYLPPDLPATVCVVLHVPAARNSRLPQILSNSGPLPASHAQDGETIRKSHIYIAPPGCHLIVKSELLSLSPAPEEHRMRPAIDPLFRSAARSYGIRVVDVILSGVLDDGTRGLIEINQNGGVGVAQEPDDARFPSMPRNAIARAHIQHVLPVRKIASLLDRLARAV